MVLTDETDDQKVIIIDFGVSVQIKGEKDKIQNKRVGTVKYLKK